jgi:perosamine synthetase
MIPWAKPTLFGREKDYVLEGLGSTWISGGPFVDQLEQSLQKYLDVSHAALTSNGTTALHLAYLALGIQQGDEIILPGFAYMGAANVAILCGARPVFVDVDPRTWCLDPNAIAGAITNKTRAIVPIHTYGNVCSLDRILDVARTHKVTVIEDAAESFASKWKGRMSGTVAPLGTYSFHATKTITTGEGGMVVTNDVALDRPLRLYRSHGMMRERRYYWHEVPGHNFRLTNLQAAMGCAQLEVIDSIISHRIRVHQSYRKELEGQAGLTLQFFESDVSPVLWAIALRLDPGAFPQGRDEIISLMRANDIECRPGFYAASQQPIYSSQPLPVSEELARQVISLPTFPDLTNDQIHYISRTLLGLRQ